jgi:hypothetical protein
LHLLAGWFCFHVLTSTLWAQHLKALAGWSALPSYWGEQVTLQDLWELVENGGLKHHWTGPWVPAAAGLAMVWFLWAGWKVQARSAGLPARLKPWLGGFLDALLIGALPLWALGFGLLTVIGKLASTGIQGLAWLDGVAGILVRLSLVSAFFLQVWLCRLGRAEGARLGRMGWSGYGSHLRVSFLRLWAHPIQWGVLLAGGTAVRTGLPLLVLILGWRLGGGTPLRVWTLLGFQAAAVVLNAWLIGWFLRVTALFWKTDEEVQRVIRDLELQTSGR